jgi:hypothetical protein
MVLEDVMKELYVGSKCSCFETKIVFCFFVWATLQQYFLWTYANYMKSTLNL